MLQENVGEDGAGFRETFSQKQLKNGRKTSENVFTASLLRLYFMFTYSLLQSNTSNFPPMKVQKRCVKHRTS